MKLMEKIYMKLFKLLKKRMIVFQWLFKSHVEENIGHKLSKKEWKEFLSFFDLHDHGILYIAGQLSEYTRQITQSWLELQYTLRPAGQIA